MNKHIVPIFAVFFNVVISYASNVPTPLEGVVIDVSVSADRSSKIFTYQYKITNPKMNGSSIYSIDLFIGRDPLHDQEVSSSGLTQCPRFHKAASASAILKRPMVSVGSKSPYGWSCSYGQLKGFAEGSFGWGGSRLIKPGSTLEGFTLTSYAPPGIRDALAEADIDYDQLPSEYYENSTKTLALENQINWKGKTIGPKAPPKVFKASGFAKYLRSLLDQSSKLAWVKNPAILKSLEAKLDQIQKKIDAGDKKTAKNILKAFVSEIEAQNGKHLASEAYALLKFNGQYLLERL
jgi:hypothetical protein